MTATRLAVAISLVAASALASAEGLDAERFAPAASAEGGFALEHPAVPFHLGWGLGLFVNVADDPVVERTASDTIVRRPVDTGASADLVGSVGLFGRVELGVHIPLRLVYDGDPYMTGGSTLSASAGIGDLRFIPKLALLRTGTLERHVLLGIAVPLSVPTGDDDAFRGAGGVTVQPQILFAAHLGQLGLGLDLGYRWRSQHPATLPWGNEITLGPWLSYGLGDKLTARAEVLSGIGVGANVDGADSPIEVLAGIDYWIGRWDLYAGGSVGLTDGIGDPDFRIITGMRFRHQVAERQGFRDRDGDGILDKDDRCPNDAEDVDGFQDADGCPEPDNDHDGIADGDDECPELSGDREHAGCPAKTYVKIDDGKIFIFGKVQFRTGSAEIDQRSDPLLDQIAQALTANPQVTRIRIEGHTDNVGDPGTNQKLSDDRAKSVKAALTKRGVDGGRLETSGLGQTKPIAPNTSAGGRQMNRRVEFVIVETSK